MRTKDAPPYFPAIYDTKINPNREENVPRSIPSHRFLKNINRFYYKKLSSFYQEEHSRPPFFCPSSLSNGAVQTHVEKCCCRDDYFRSMSGFLLHQNSAIFKNHRIWRFIFSRRTVSPSFSDSHPYC